MFLLNPLMLTFLSKRTTSRRRLITTIKICLIANISLLFLFLLLTNLVLEKKILYYDQLISGFIYSYRTPILTIVMTAITNLTDFPAGFVLSLAIVLLLLKKYKKEVFIFALSIIISCILSNLLKMFFRVPRPAISPLEEVTDFTYPSGHAIGNLVLYGLLAFFTFHIIKNKSVGIFVGVVILIWIGLIGLSRIYLGAHYPSDVLAGYLVGLWWLVMVWLIGRIITFYRRINNIH